VPEVRQIFIWNGKNDLGPFTDEELMEKVKSGAVRPADYYFIEGMRDWERVAHLPVCKKLLATSRQKQMLDEMGVKYDEFLTKTDVSGILANQPATQRQLDYLKSFGVTPAASFTKAQASEMIERCVADPVAREQQAQIRAAEFERQRREREAFPSYYLKQDIVAAERELAGLKRTYEEKTNELARDRRKLGKLQRLLEKSNDEIERLALEQKIVSVKEEIESTEAEIERCSEDLKDAKEEFEYRRSLRKKFWKGTFSAGALSSEDLEDLADYLDAIDRLHAEYGRKLKVPTLKQVEDLLAAVDNASADWDKERPDRFYSKYTASFPEAVKRSRAKQSAAKQGCTILGLAIGLPVAAILIRIFC
jgi:predicted  nucleic acid-binding Zn-ribbon protein